MYGDCDEGDGRVESVDDEDDAVPAVSHVETSDDEDVVAGAARVVDDDVSDNTAGGI